MTAFRSTPMRDAGFTASVRQAGRALLRPVAVFLKDAGHGLLEVCHNSLALVGLGVVAAALFLAGRPELRQSLELRALGWLQVRQDLRVDADPSVVVAMAEPDAIDRVTALDPQALPRSQAAVAQWLARRYRVAPEPVGRLVQEAWEAGRRAKVDPTLILAVIAIESRFNPFAQSPVGAQGLMQVMTRVHDDKYERFGGTLAALDPLANLRVGVQILKEMIERTGSVELALKHYVGAAHLDDDRGYASKVLAEQAHLRQVAAGRQLSHFVPQGSGLPRPATGSASAAGTPAADAQLGELLPTEGFEPDGLLPPPHPGGATGALTQMPLPLAAVAQQHASSR